MLLSKGEHSGAGSISITYYTDPLCCWSWAFEAEWRQLLLHLRPARYRYVMGGLLPDWHNYHDSTLNVERPAQMGPIWMQAAALCGVPINTAIWVRDPPASSYPACIAVKCAGLQSFEAEEAYLTHARKAVMENGINISRPKVLTGIAETLAAERPGLLDVDKFIQDFFGRAGADALRMDLQEVQYKKIDRFPALVIKYGNARAPFILTGYKPFALMRDLISNQAGAPVD